MNLFLTRTLHYLLPTFKKNCVTTKMKYEQNKSGFTNRVDCIQLHQYEYVCIHGYDYYNVDFLIILLDLY